MASTRRAHLNIPAADSPSTQLKSVAEFFAGIGLMRMGLEKEGWNIVFANDISSEKYASYAANFLDADNHFVLEDIHNLAASRIPQTTLATASFPCTNLSLAGMREGLDGKESSAFWGFAKRIEEMATRRPQIILLENVTGFLTSNGGKDFEAALLTLNKLGYAVDAFVIDAERFVPQSRVRLFVLGTQTRKQVWEAKETPAFYEDAVRPPALADFVFRHPKIDWNIRSLPPLPQRCIALEDVLEDFADDSDWWWREDRTSYLVSQMSAKHHLELLNMKNAESWRYGTVFRRVRSGRSMAELRTDGIAGCLRTPKGGSGRQILIKAGLGVVKARLLSPRECARLMGADDYVISVPLNQALFGFGDAVCVPVVQWIARNYLNPLVEETRDRLIA